jgi:hypothetical protein
MCNYIMHKHHAHTSCTYIRYIHHVRASFMPHTCILHVPYCIICTRSDPGPGVRRLAPPAGSTAALAQQSEGWCARSGTIEADTMVPWSTIWDSPEPCSSVDVHRFEGFSLEKGNEPSGLCRNDPGYPKSVVRGLRSVTRYLHRIPREQDLGPHLKRNAR